MDSEVFASFKLLFEAFAFEPVANKKILTDSLIGFHAGFAIAQLFVILKYWNYIIYTYDPIGKTSDYIKVFSTFFCYASGIFVSWRKEKCYVNIAYQVKNLEILMEKLYVNVSDVQKRFHKSYKRKFVLLLTVQVYGIVQELIFKQGETQTSRYIAAFTFPSIFCTLKALHAVFYVQMNNNFFSVLNDQLLHVNELLKINEEKLLHKKYNKFLFKRLKVCRNFYRILININGSQNECMGLYSLVDQINLYVHILSSLYWTTFRIFNQEFELLICEFLWDFTVWLNGNISARFQKIKLKFNVTFVSKLLIHNMFYSSILQL